MKEAGYQAKLMSQIQEMGGIAINGNFTSNGEADLQCGIPITMYDARITTDCNPRGELPDRTILIHVAIEVKTELDYRRVMGAIDVDYNITNKKALKQHEVLQMAKIRRNRKLGGLALVAYNIKQVMEYIHE